MDAICSKHGKMRNFVKILLGVSQVMRLHIKKATINWLLNWL